MRKGIGFWSSMLACFSSSCVIDVLDFSIEALIWSCMLSLPFLNFCMNTRYIASSSSHTASSKASLDTARIS